MIDWAPFEVELKYRGWEKKVVNHALRSPRHRERSRRTLQRETASFATFKTVLDFEAFVDKVRN